MAQNDVRSLHVHIYDNSEVATDSQTALAIPLVAELDLQLLDEYDDYFQFGFSRNGEWFEIRVPKEKP